MPLTTGETLQNRYQIVDLLGQGGMGAVYRARDTRLRISIAIKELLPQPGLDAETLSHLRGQFEQEAQILARLDHPHLVNVTDYFDEGGRAYLVMKFIEGESLADYIAREGALPEAQVLTWAGQILEALTYCHAQRILHRDIKPQNIVIQPDGSAVLVDFGLVKLWDPADPRTRTAIRGAGTPEYAPPEQYSGQGGHTDPRSDLYSLGATLYQALTGQVPPAVTDRMAFPQRFKTPRELNGRVSPETDGVIQRAMALPIDERWASAGQMAAALPVGSAVDPGRPEQPAPRRRGLPVWIWGGGALLLLALLALGALATGLLGGGGTPTAVAGVTRSDLDASSVTPKATPVVAESATPTVEPPTATLEPASTPRPVLTYEIVSLQAVANAEWGEFQAPPQGEVILGEVPFSLGPAIFKSQADPAPNSGYPTEAAIDLEIARPQRAFLLLTAGNAFARYDGETVGEVRALCDGSEERLAVLSLGRNLREWHSVGEVVTTAPETEPVWRGALADFPDLVGQIDMLTLSLPEACREGTLTSLRVLDQSVEGVGSRDPALNLIGLTVEHYR